MKLVTVIDAHRLQMMQWFPDQRSCVVWAGPEFRYPFTESTFREDMRLDLPTYALIADDDELLGFGQYYLRVGRCHLARLAISPLHRGRALGALLVQKLCQRGCSDLNVDHCSLFVYPDNTPAIHLYERLGFAPTPYPERGPQFDACVYMLASPDVIGAWKDAQQGA